MLSLNLVILFSMHDSRSLENVNVLPVGIVLMTDLYARMAFCSCVTKQLKNLQRANGPVPREHGLVGHMPATTYPFEVISDAAHFIRNFAECYGIPQPAAQSGRASNPPIYLPASLNYKIVHSKYVEACQLKDTHVRFLAYKSFVNMWKKCLADIVFMTFRINVCAICVCMYIHDRYPVDFESGDGGRGVGGEGGQ